MRLTNWQLARAFSMWSDGFDTFDIAKALDVGEHVVANSMAERRDLDWKMRKTLRALA